MENKTKSKVEEIYENCNKNIRNYNSFMNDLFSQLSKKKFSFLKNTKMTKEEVIANMNENIKILIDYIFKLKETVYKDKYKCLSCIFGAFLGDATGAYCEFHEPSEENIKKIFIGNPMFGEDPGQVTDDSEMAISSAFAIMDNPEKDNLNSDYLYYYYGLWHISNPEDEGNTTKKALSKFKASDFNPNNKNNYEKNFNNILKLNYNSLANGFLMRTSPFIVWYYYRFKNQIIETFNKKENSSELFNLFTKIEIQAKKDNICTHPNNSLSIAHSIFCIIALGAICGLKPSQIINNVKTLLKNSFFSKKESISIRNMINEEIAIYEENKILCQFKNSFEYFTNRDKNVNTHMGFYFHAFRLTLYYLFFFNEIKAENHFTKFRVIMNQICSFGGDTDTNAAIVGTVIGPLIGYKNFGDKEFLKMVSLVPKNRFIYSPGLMVLYINYLEMNKGNEESKIFLTIILNMMFEKIDPNNLNNFFLIKKTDEGKTNLQTKNKGIKK